MFTGRGFHYYHQIEQSDCGVTCLRMIARHFGRKIPAKFLRSRADLSRGGISVRGLKECAESIGMKGYGVKLGSGLLVDAPLPAILHWNQNHFAVLWKVRKGRYFVADPAAGMMVYSREEFDAHFCGDGERGIALILAPTEEFHSISFPADDSRGKIFRSLRDSIREHCSTYLLILSLALLALGASIFVPLLMQKTIDEGIARRDKYPGSDSQPVIGDLGLTIPREKTTAIVGPSGCGKSTLMKLLQGLYHPQQGSITAGMVDVATLQPQEWGKICTSVSQQGYIFSDSIARNIALGDESPDMERVADATRTACLGPLLDKLPLKLHTLIGPSGMELSGGERQRLMIARAVYRDTPVILLDEATSSLDAETERRIVANLSGFGQGRTMVIAAHRLSTVSNADLILFMDSGRIIEQGTHSSLMSLGGRYASFVSGQLTS